MKNFKSSIILLMLMALINSCKKYSFDDTPMASLMIVNVIPNGKAVKFGSYGAVIANNTSAYVGLYPGDQSFYIWPTDDSLHPYYMSDKNISIAVGEIYSLYITGTISAPEGLLVREELPYHTDSTAGIRFINLSSSKKPINITLLTSPSINEVSSLGYKSATEFKTYDALANSAYTFQVRDAATNNVYTSISFTPATLPRFSNITLVIKGEGSTIGITRVNNDK